MSYCIDSPDDTALIVLWKVGRSKEIAVWDLREARQLKHELDAAIAHAEAIELAEDNAVEAGERRGERE